MQRSTWQTPEGETVVVMDPENSSEAPDWAGYWQPGQVICLIGKDERRMILDRPDKTWKMLSGESDFDPLPAEMEAIGDKLEADATSEVEKPENPKPVPAFDDLDGLLELLKIEKKPSKAAELEKIGVEHIGGGVYSVSSGTTNPKQVRGKDAAILLALQRIAMTSRAAE